MHGLPGIHSHDSMRIGGGHSMGGVEDVTMGRVCEMDEMDEDMESQSGSGSGESMEYDYNEMNVDVSAANNAGRQMGYGDRLY